MGCLYSRMIISKEEMVCTCKARKRYMKQFVKARKAFSAAHNMYLRSLRNNGSAIVQFATSQTQPLNPSPSPVSPTFGTSTSTNTSTTVRLPQPPDPSSSMWELWDLFIPTSGRSVDEEEWEETTTGSEVATATGTDLSSEVGVVLSSKSKDLVEILQELGEYFGKAAKAGGMISMFLEVPTSKEFLWTRGSSCVKWSQLRDPIANMGCMGADGKPTHRSTVERLYAWERKLYQEVKNAEYLKLEHKKKTAISRKLEMKNVEYLKNEKAKKELEKLESHMKVASMAIEATSAEIVKLRESELYPQLLSLVKGLMNMWRSMYEFHQVQIQIVQQLKYLDCITSNNPTSEIHRQSTLQLELEAQQWHLSFCNLVKAQRDYIQYLTSYLRFSLFQVGNNLVQKTRQESNIYLLSEQWQLANNNVPDKVASEGIKSFLIVIHSIVMQQAKEHKQKKRSELTFKELEKKVFELRSLENKYGPHIDKSKDLVRVKRAKVDTLRAKAEDEKGKYVKSISMTRAMTLSNLQMGLPHVFEAMTGFANFCAQAFESVHNQAKSTNDLHNVKMILP